MTEYTPVWQKPAPEARLKKSGKNYMLPGPLALATPPRQFIRQPIMKILSPDPPTVPHRFIFSMLNARHLHSPLKFPPATSRIFLQTMLSQQPI